MDQVPCDSDCLADRRLSGFDNRIRDIRLALGCVNGLTGRFAAIYSTSKPDTGTIPDAHSHRSACNESNTDSYTDADAVAKSSAYAGEPSDSSTPPPIVSFIGFKHSNRRWVSYRAAIRVYDDACNVIETHEHTGDFKEFV